MITKTNFYISKDQSERFAEDVMQDKFCCLYADSDSMIEQHFPWHWHNAFEIDYIEGCDTRFDFVGNSVVVPSGSAIFINSGAVHSYYPIVSEECRIFAILFDPLFLGGNFEHVFFKKYVDPILKADWTHLLIENEKDPSKIGVVKSILKNFQEEPLYYELQIHSAIGNIWCMILNELEKKTFPEQKVNRSTERVRQMLNFIHENYERQITLQDISDAAMISTRECSRCFHKCIGCSPVQYLTDYRIQRAISKLILTEMSITMVSEICGFSSVSYFCKVLKKQTGQTPFNYRKHNKQTKK